MPRTPQSPLDDLDRFLDAAGPAFEIREEARVRAGAATLPVVSIALGNPSPDVPAVGYFGGVHGLERIGSEVVIAFLRSLQKRLEWDVLLHRKLEALRIVFMPIVNPGGLRLGTRANPGGVDLMRNAPLDATEAVPFLIGGQRRSARLPWYRGPADAAMEPEANALCAVVARELLGRRFSLALDCHSGFGLRDRLWFPFACSTRPIRHLPEMHALAGLYGGSYAHHRYLIEPQSRQYCAHGDLWDFLYLRSCENADNIFLPLTLEMGSWSWVKKNPRQLFSRLGIFNPQIEHRQHRVLRRHIGLMEFLSRAACSADRWLPAGPVREAHQVEAWRRWYAEPT
jgi:hypothetical protein